MDVKINLDDYKSFIIDRIDTLVKENGESDTGFSVSLGYTESFFAGIKSKRRWPTLENLLLIARHFNITVTELLDPEYLIRQDELSRLVRANLSDNDVRTLIEMFEKLDQEGIQALMKFLHQLIGK